MDEKSKTIKLLPFEDLKKALNEKGIEYDENGEQLPPIEGTISCSFMAREKWILDFGAKIIYKRKKKDRLKEAV